MFIQHPAEEHTVGTTCWEKRMDVKGMVGRKMVPPKYPHRNPLESVTMLFYLVKGDLKNMLKVQGYDMVRGAQIIHMGPI